MNIEWASTFSSYVAEGRTDHIEWHAAIHRGSVALREPTGGVWELTVYTMRPGRGLDDDQPKMWHWLIVNGPEARRRAELGIRALATSRIIELPGDRIAAVLEGIEKRDPWGGWEREGYQATVEESDDRAEAEFQARCELAGGLMGLAAKGVVR